MVSFCIEKINSSRFLKKEERGVYTSEVRIQVFLKSSLFTFFDSHCLYPNLNTFFSLTISQLFTIQTQNFLQNAPKINKTKKRAKNYPDQKRAKNYPETVRNFPYFPIPFPRVDSGV